MVIPIVVKGLLAADTGARERDKIVLYYKNASVPRLMTTVDNPAGMMVFTEIGENFNFDRSDLMTVSPILLLLLTPLLSQPTITVKAAGNGSGMMEVTFTGGGYKGR